MVKSAVLSLLVAARLAVPAAAQSVDRETLSILGWNNACSIALTHFGYPAKDSPYHDEPFMVRVGALTIPPGSQKAKPRWLVSQNGGYAWNEAQVGDAVDKLKAAGYTRAGFVEMIRADPSGVDPSIESLLRSTAALSATATKGWPDRDYGLVELHYSPLTDCALAVYRFARSKNDYFFYTLTRMENLKARVVRAKAHTDMARLLLEDGDIQGALAETEIAASLAPESALARYGRAAALCLEGSMEESLAELTEAVRIDPAYAEKARGDIDFETLRRDRRFKELTKAAPKH